MWRRGAVSAELVPLRPEGCSSERVCDTSTVRLRKPLRWEKVPGVSWEHGGMQEDELQVIWRRFLKTQLDI